MWVAFIRAIPRVDRLFARSESAREPDAHADMGKAMKALFKTFDHDRSGSVNLDEFVQAQELALELYGSLPGSVERRNVVEQYLLARTPGESELRGGGLSLEDRGTLMFRAFGELLQAEWCPESSRNGS